MELRQGSDNIKKHNEVIQQVHIPIRMEYSNIKGRNTTVEPPNDIIPCGLNDFDLNKDIKCYNDSKINQNSDHVMLDGGCNIT